MITDYNYNYFFQNVIDYNYRLHCKVIMITLWLLMITFEQYINCIKFQDLIECYPERKT